MKNLIIIITLLSGLAVTTAFTNTEETKQIVTSDYCRGWEDGFCEGWKDVKGEFTICPVAPVCPLPRIGEFHYKGGYNRGFKAGRISAKNN